MTPNEYRLLSRWRVDGRPGEVAEVLGDPLGLAHWWPSVYLDVEELRPPDARGLGRRVRLRTKGWLPYTILWESEVVESRYPYGFTILANGDFEGRGRSTFEQDGSSVNLRYDWRLRAEKPLLRNLSSLLKPVRSEPPVGDGAGRSEFEARARAASRDVGCGESRRAAASRPCYLHRRRARRRCR